MNLVRRGLIATGLAGALLSGCSGDNAAQQPPETAPTTVPRDPLCTYRDEADFEAMLRQRIQIRFEIGWAEGECSDGNWTWSDETTRNMPAAAMFDILDLSFTTVGWVRSDGPEPFSATWSGECSPTLQCEATAIVTDTLSGAHAEMSARSVR